MSLQRGVDYEEHDLNEKFTKWLDTSIRQSIGGYWASRQRASLYDSASHATLPLKLEQNRRGSSNSQIDVTSQNRGTMLQRCSQPLSLITTSEMRSISIQREFEGSSKLVVTKYGFWITLSSSTEPSTYQLSVQALTKEVDSCEVFFEKTCWAQESLILLKNQKKRIAQAQFLIIETHLATNPQLTKDLGNFSRTSCSLNI